MEEMLSIKQKIFMMQKIKIVFAGNSQVWGQGARGWKDALPDIQQGEIRRLPNHVPSCVRMLERHLQEIRGVEKETIVINGAVGSTPTNQYYEKYFREMVLDHAPDIVPMMFAINDWIRDRNISLEQYRRNLIRMIEDLHDIGAHIIMITQSPVLGSQFSKDHYYPDYIDVFRKVAQAYPRIKLADANLYMQRFLSDGIFEQNAEWLYEDAFHCNQVGQFIYLKVCMEAMGI